ncbi:hypothetical protein E2493_20920 [Sphingomonas parva]|uniref:DUF5681 domain-containing protein n=2 Tax=Sphingomonas parva TaxID=2555898 RepID=A0A4Y8ZJW6_9SPHN|nr:hypothetical protein E2493_20920 [Sphingomonas parva]
MCDLGDISLRSSTGQFLPGQSGNPAGRPRGARNKASVLGDLIDAEVKETIVIKVVARALAGEWPALRACFTRLVPRPREAPVAIDLPPVASALDVAEAGTALIAAVAAGEVTPREAQQVMRLLTAQLRLLAAADQARDAVTEGPRPAADAPKAATSCVSPVPSDVEEPVAGDGGTDRAARREAPGTAQAARERADPDGANAAPAAAAAAPLASHACISPVSVSHGRFAVPRHVSPLELRADCGEYAATGAAALRPEVARRFRAKLPDAGTARAA